jgi:uncharacterized membrane protein YccC
MDNEPDLYPLEEPKKHKRPGRPPGSVQQRAMLKRFQEIYDKIKGMLNDEQRSYYELFMLQFSLYTASVLDEAIENKKISEGLAQTLAQYRMGLKDVEDMHRKREELEAKKDANGKSVDPTRESSESRLDELIARASQGAKK